VLPLAIAWFKAAFCTEDAGAGLAQDQDGWLRGQPVGGIDCEQKAFHLF